MKRTLRPIALGATALLISLGAQALVVDTGPGGPFGGGYSLYDDRPAGSGFQRLAARFEATEAAVVDTLGGWMNRYSDGAVVFALHADAGGLPGSELFATTVMVAATGFGPQWRGATGLGWAIAPGQYWLSLSDVAGDGSSGSMPEGAPAPAAGYAFMGDGTSDWARADPMALGVRINAPVPEPSTTLLMALGGLGLLALRRRR